MQCAQAVSGWRVALAAPGTGGGRAVVMARVGTPVKAASLSLRVIRGAGARRAYAGSVLREAAPAREAHGVTTRGLSVRVRALGENEAPVAGPAVRKGTREERKSSWAKTAGQVALVSLAAMFSGVAGARAVPLQSGMVTATVVPSSAMDTGIELADASATAEAPTEAAAEAPVKKKKKKKKVAPPAEEGTAAETVAAAPAPPTPAVEEDPTVDQAEAAKKAAAKDAPTKDGLSYTQMWDMVKDNKVKRAEYCRDRCAVMVTLKEAFEGKLQHRVMLPFDPDLHEYFMKHGVEVDVLPQTVWDMISAGMARTLTPIIVCICLFILVTRSIGGPSDDLSTPLAKKVNIAEVTTTMSDVAGIDHVQEEIFELIDYLRDADRYMDMGARLPAGVLMVGPPGTGKTLLAKAIAGEAQVPFFSAAGSEFTEMFVGVGASRVRNLFANARKVAPCIIFIDEFDAIGASRTLSMGGMGGMGNEEQANTINQMLTEMDGFEDNKGIVVLAATNRPAVLDEALTRPGRFDRVLHLPFPGVEGRAQILQVHARDKQIKGDVDWQMIARGCAGWTGADIMSLMNESAMLAIRQGKDQLEEHHIVESLEKLKRDAITQGGNKVEKTSGGDESDIQALDPLVRRSICIIEAGRALLGHLTPYYDDLQRVTVFPNGRVSGHTLFVPQESQLESGVMTRGYLESQMVIAMAGRCAERLLLGDDYVTGSSAGYMKDANLIARQMVMRYGYSDKLGPVSLMAGGQQVYLHTDRAEVAYAPMAPETSELVLNETLEKIKNAEAKAMYGLSKNIEILKELERVLMDRRSISGADVKALCDKMGAVPYWDTAIGGFTFSQDGKLVVPPTPEDLASVDNAEPSLTFSGLPGDGVFPSENN